MTDLNGKVVLVTGSSRGIGAEIAVAFARQGANVVLHGRDTEARDKSGPRSMESLLRSRSTEFTASCREQHTRAWYGRVTMPK
jgi:NAD(P)-dependent dehydrogenase (short-subunit alcohol dehydrogenase family)